MASRTALIDALRAHFQHADLGQIARGLRDKSLPLTGLAELYDTWEKSFLPPPLPPSDELRPLVPGEYGIHHVAVPTLHSAYDDEYDVFTSDRSSLYWYFYEAGRTDPGGRAVSLQSFIDDVKLHLLYSHAIAFEIPLEASKLSYRHTAAGRLVALCAALEPLIESGVVTLVPRLERSSEDLGKGRGALYRLLGETSWDSDPLGPLNGPYSSAYDMMAGEAKQAGRPHGRSDFRRFEESVRSDRLRATVEPLASGLVQIDRYDQAFDLYVTRPDIAILRRIAAHNDPLAATMARAARASQPLLTFAQLSAISIPTGKLATSDIVSIRRNGEFTAFRNALGRGIARVTRNDIDELFDPKSRARREIRDELMMAQDSASRDMRKSKWIRQHMPDLAELTVVSAVGAAGAVAANPIVGAAAGAGTYATAKLVQWLKGRPVAGTGAYARHMALFEEPPRR